MESGDKSIDEYLSFNPSAFEVLDRFTVQQYEIFEDTYSSRYFLSVEIWLSQYSSKKAHTQLRLRFGGIQELRFHQGFYPLTLCLGIRSVRQDQWEYLRYSVADEEGRVSFYCRSFKADLVEGNGS